MNALTRYHRQLDRREFVLALILCAAFGAALACAIRIGQWLA